MSVAVESTLLQRSDALSEVLGDLDRWLGESHVFPIDAKTRKAVAGDVGDLRAQIRQLIADPALLIVVLMGGTGVGKSTLLNALARSKIAEASLARPTTRIPTVYHHREVSLDRFGPAFANCRSVAHERDELRYKVLVDTPDVDGSEIENRRRLIEMLPAADAVLYVGSQEKYHDHEGWSLLLRHRQSRGFAFVLNKWDRCLDAALESSGQSPDEDFKHSLTDAGFDAPLVFRTCANQWSPSSAAQDDSHRIDDDFPQLEAWLDTGLDEQIIHEIKTRGMLGKLERLAPQLETVTPPRWSEKAFALTQEWKTALRDAVTDHARVLVRATDRFAAPLERHFSKLGRGDTRGVFGKYLNLVAWISRVNLSVMAPLEIQRDSPINELASKCVAEIPSDTRQSHYETLRARLLALADRSDWPVQTLKEFLPDQEGSSMGDRGLADVLVTQLEELERDYSEPSGGRMATRFACKLLCDWTPITVLILIVVKFFYDAFATSLWGMNDLLLAVVVFALTLLGLHFLLAKLVPVRWDALRVRLQKRIEDKMIERIGPMYLGAIARFSKRTATEREIPLRASALVADLRDQLRRITDSAGRSDLFARQSQ